MERDSHKAAHTNDQTQAQKIHTEIHKHTYLPLISNSRRIGGTNIFNHNTVATSSRLSELSVSMRSFSTNGMPARFAHLAKVNYTRSTNEKQHIHRRMY